MAVKRYNATLRNLEYRLRAFKDNLPIYLEDIVRDKEDVIVSAIANDQLYRRGINGRGEKIMGYMPYTAKTIQNKKDESQEPGIVAVPLDAEIEDTSSLKQIAQQKEKIKRQQNTIQELRIAIGDCKRDKDRLQKDNTKLQNECNKQQKEIDRLIQCKENLEIQMKQSLAELEEKDEEIKTGFLLLYSTNL